MVSFLRRLKGLVPMKGLLRPPLRFLKRRRHRRRAAAYRRSLACAGEGPRVLILMDGGIGNAVEVTPLVQALRMHWPRARITILPTPGDLFDGWSVVDEVARSRADLDGRAFDHTFVTWAAALPEDAVTPAMGRVHRTYLILGRWMLRPEREYNMDLARDVGYRGGTPPLHVAVREPRDDIPGGSPRICIAPGGKPLAAWRHKRWPFFEDLVARLVETHPEGRVLIVGGPDDRLPEGATRSPRVVDLRGRHTLAETAWVLRSADLVIANDCGPAHVADAVGARTLVLFGPTCELKNGPRNRGTVLAADVPCRPCQHDVPAMAACMDPVCMTGITPEAVMAAVEKMTGGRKA